jgi:hypothetical protein
MKSSVGQQECVGIHIFTCESKESNETDIGLLKLKNDRNTQTEISRRQDHTLKTILGSTVYDIEILFIL